MSQITFISCFAAYARCYLEYGDDRGEGTPLELRVRWLDQVDDQIAVTHCGTARRTTRGKDGGVAG